MIEILLILVELSSKLYWDCEDCWEFYIGIGQICCFVCFTGKNCSDDIQECASSPCLYNGTCTEPVVNGNHCQCLPGVQGNSCQHVTMATFDGTSLVSLKPLTTNQQRGKRSVDAVSREVVNHSERQQWSHVEYLVRYPRQSENSVLDMKFTFKTTVKEGILLLALGVSVMAM